MSGHNTRDTGIVTYNHNAYMLQQQKQGSESSKRRRQKLNPNTKPEIKRKLKRVGTVERHGGIGRTEHKDKEKGASHMSPLIGTWRNGFGGRVRQQEGVKSGWGMQATAAA